jgi:hypothetical protein
MNTGAGTEKSTAKTIGIVSLITTFEGRTRVVCNQCEWVIEYDNPQTSEWLAISHNQTYARFGSCR